MTVFVCGPSLPKIGSRVPMRRELHDNGFGMCDVLVTGLYGERKPRPFCSFAAYPSNVWRPREFPPKSLSWLERRIKTWDKSWPDAKWEVRLFWPWQTETWERVKPGTWLVTQADISSM